MAVTASVAASPTSGPTGSVVNALVTVTNSNASTCNVLGVSLTAVPTGASNYEAGDGVAVGNVNFGPNSNSTVTLSGGTLVVTVPMVFHAPSGAYNTQSPSSTYTIRGTVYTNASGSDAAVDVTSTTYTSKYAVQFSASES